MSTWLIFCSIWAVCALCIVLFVRGAHPYIEDTGDDARDDTPNLGALTPARVRSAERGHGNA
jgi:hypothetical protein